RRPGRPRAAPPPWPPRPAARSEMSQRTHGSTGDAPRSDGGRSLCDVFYRSVETFRKPDHLLYKKDGAWRKVSSDELRQAAEEVSLGLVGLGLEPGDRVALLSENRPEWVFVDLGTLCAGAVTSPVYTTLSPPQVLHILNDSQARICVVSGSAQLAKVAEVRRQAPALRHVIRMDTGAQPAADTL